MLTDAKGVKLFRKVIVKIVFPDAIFPPKIIVQKAGAKMGFNPDGIDEILMKTADHLDTLYPFWEFKVVELTSIGKTARYVFTFAGYRVSASVAAGAPPNGTPPFTEQTESNVVVYPDDSQAQSDAVEKFGAGRQENLIQSTPFDLLGTAHVDS